MRSRPRPPDPGRTGRRYTDGSQLNGPLNHSPAGCIEPARPNKNQGDLMRPLLIALLGLPLCAAAQRADDNAVRSADDAFGNSVGNENIGLYNPFEVRGFSAVDAGNERLNGLYFDRQADPSHLLVPSSTMRVGISAQGYLLPAPTGIVDYELARAGEQLRFSPVVGYGPFDTRFAELEVELPLLSDRLGVAAGAMLIEEAFESGADERSWAVAMVPRWRPSESIEIMPFYSRTIIKDSEADPLIFVSGPHLPPKVERDHFYGQRWADNEDDSANYGVVASFALASGWAVNVGAFRSRFAAPASYADLFVNTTAEGLAERFIIADPEQRFASTSGELRISKGFEEGVRRHTLYYSLRGRDQQRRYGGSDVQGFGIARIGERVTLVEPQFDLGPQTQDEVQQWTHAVAYQGRWATLAEVSLGLQKTRYEKKVTPPGEASQVGEDRPWLYNAGLALHASERLAWYASYSTGLEEGGVAPENASNKDAAPPAIRTKQWDAGLRYAFTPALKLVAGVFDIEKPYYGLDDANTFRELGRQQHRGFEFSIAGQVVEGLNVVIGTLLLEPRVQGEEVTSGRIGKIPVAQTERVTIASADYRLPRLRSLSFDATVESIDSRMASSDNRLSIPARSVLSLGARWRFSIGRAPATLRFHCGNVFDTFGWRTNSSEVFVTNAPRRYSISIAADFLGGER
jgi:iron complex outermembrane recepter protein